MFNFDLMTEEQLYFNEIGAEIVDSSLSQMFGKPCFKINKKAFVCFFENEMVFKITGDAHRDALSLDGAQLFDPSGKGRAMKEWVQVPYDYKDQWLSFAKAAAEYLNSK